MKKFSSLLVIIFVVGLAISCQKATEINVQLEKKIPTIENLSNSNSFAQLVIFVDKQQDQMTKIDKSVMSQTLLENYMTSSTLTESQIKQVARYYGYSNLSDFLNMFKEQDLIIKNLKNEFKDFNLVKLETFQIAINNVKQKNNKYKIFQLSPEAKCLEIYNNCLAQASSTYYLNIASCTTGAVAFGSVSLGLAGVAFQLGCGGFAYYHLSNQRDGCYLAYQTCLGL